MKKFLFLLIILFLPIKVAADSGKSTVIMDIDSGRILYGNNINERRLIASITKIMTCIIVLENSDIESSITVGDEVLSMYGTNIYIESGEVLKIKDLLYGLMLRSGNDAAITLAYNTLGYDKFLYKMNEKAKEIGMNNTLFSNPHGLDDDTENISTAYDMALLSRYAYNNSIYREIISTRKYITSSSLKSYVWYNRMGLLSSYKNCTGGKNGYTPRAGKTLVSYAKKGDLVFTIVSLDDNSIYDNHKKLYKEFFLKYNNYDIIEKGDLCINNEKYYIDKTFKYVLKSDELDDISTLVKIGNNLESKVAGKIEVLFDNELIGSVNIYRNVSTKKEKKNLLQKIIDLISGNSIKIN